MAIIKELETKFGIEAAYHRITAFNISYKHRKVILCVGSYISKVLRVNKAEPIDEVDIEVPYSDYPLFLKGNPVETSYLWLKQNVIGFEDAEDDFDIVEPYEPELIIDEPDE